MSKSEIIGVSCWLFLSLLTSSGCSVHTIDFNPQPAQQASSSYSEISDAISNEYSVWWQQFSNPELDVLIHTALENNFGIIASVARLEQSRALVIQARADRLPFIDLAGQTEQSWREGEDRDHFSDAGILFSWEIDAFNRLDSIRLARQSEAEASQEDIEAVRLRLSTEVAAVYYDAVAQNLELALLRAQLKVDEELLDLTQLRFESGLTSSVQ